MPAEYLLCATAFPWPLETSGIAYTVFMLSVSVNMTPSYRDRNASINATNRIYCSRRYVRLLVRDVCILEVPFSISIGSRKRRPSQKRQAHNRHSYTARHHQPQNLNSSPPPDPPPQLPPPSPPFPHLKKNPTKPPTPLPPPSQQPTNPKNAARPPHPLQRKPRHLRDLQPGQRRQRRRQDRRRHRRRRRPRRGPDHHGRDRERGQADWRCGRGAGERG